MTIPEKLREVMNSKGHTQTWVVAQMNRIKPELQMTVQKLSASLLDKRTLSVDEFIAFCEATETDPNEFWKLQTAC